MEAATNAISARLVELARDSPDAVGQGRLLVLVGLLHEPGRTTQENAAAALIHVTSTNTNAAAICDAVCEAGGIAPLVALLHAGAESPAARNAAAALQNLASDNAAIRDAIREAGGIAPLVALLHAGAGSLAARYAAAAL